VLLFFLSTTNFLYKQKGWCKIKSKNFTSKIELHERKFLNDNESRSPLLCQSAFDFESRALEASPPPFSSTTLSSNDRQHPMEKINLAPRMSETVHSDSHLTLNPGKFMSPSLLPIDVVGFVKLSSTRMCFHPTWREWKFSMNFMNSLLGKHNKSLTSNLNVWKFPLKYCQQLSSSCQNNPSHNIVQNTQKLRLSWRIIFIYCCSKATEKIII